ncbi:MAG: hypothetical protein H6613_14940 [Ignavibacteriales bacterium]|nr:hypothetical protein [Ignavibacteriales bacterium]
MNQPDWEKVEKLFEEAIELDKDKRISFLKNKCGNNKKLFDEVVSLLEADENVNPVLDKKASDIINIEEKINFIGQQIGVYKIIKEIATGGMGSVF